MIDLPSRIEVDAQRLFLAMMLDESRRFSVLADGPEYADAVLTILEGLYPGAADRIEFVYPNC